METGSRVRTLTLPGGLSQRAAPLARLARACYPDMLVAVNEHAAGWRVSLAPPGELIRAYDPGIASVLAARHIDCRDLMPWHHRVTVGGVLWQEAMYRSWALLAWSRRLREGGRGRPWLIHVAPDDDLNVPALLCHPGAHALNGIMEDLDVDLTDCATVRTAIERGLIGVGSYIAPFLSAQPSDIVHLAPALAGPALAAPRRFSVEGERDGHSRLVLREAPQGSCTYRKTFHATSVGEGWDARQPVLLDIDLSYFDVLPKRRREPRGAACTVLELIEGIQPLRGAIAAVTIGYSPGSCPSAQWAGLVDQLRSALFPLP